MKLSNLKINGMTQPIGFDLPNPRVAWQVLETEAAEVKNACVEVSRSEDFSDILFKKEGKLAQTGEKLEMGLSPRARYFVRLSVEGDNGESALGETFFETAKLDEPWSAAWIRSQEGDDFHPLFHKAFPVEKEVKSARLYISGLGMYEASINGEKVGEEFLTPYYSDYHTEVQYQTFDITKMLKAENEIEVLLGNGWYKGKFGLGHQENNFGDFFALLAEIRISFVDGTEEVIGSDETWQYRGSDIESSSIYDGEVVNRLLWGEEEAKNEWRTPVRTEIEGVVTARYSHSWSSDCSSQSSRPSGSRSTHSTPHSFGKSALIVHFLPWKSPAFSKNDSSTSSCSG